MPQQAPNSKFSVRVNRILDCITLKVIFSIHFILLSIALTVLNWLPVIFLYYNCLFLLLLLWGIHLTTRTTDQLSNITACADVVLLAAVVNGTSIALDIICICTMYDLVSSFSRFAPSFVFIILNLVLRPVSTFILTRLYYSKSTTSRGGPQALPTSNASSVYPGPSSTSSPLSGAIRKILLLDAATSDSGRSIRVRECYREEQQQPDHLRTSHQQQLSQPQHKRVSSLQLIRPGITLNTSTTTVQSQSVTASAAAPVVQTGKQTADSISLASALSISELSTNTIEPISSSTTPLPAPRQSQSPTNSTTANHCQSTYIDPETGEAFQERMI